MQQFWCYPGTATCYCWNEMSNSSYSSVFHDFSGVLENLAPGVARGYAPGHKKICIFPQATP
ncbi:hypothetical protein T09_930 [Trichinella sp. T9]|nr:hypothetical protein T09_930 [Trichinella sp. T9]